MDKDLADEILEEEAENEAEKQLEEEEQQEPEEETAEAEETAKKSFFKKKEKKKDKKDIQIEELTDRLKRTMAEFDNFRKRTEKEKSAMFDMGAKTIVEKILPIVDNFERGLAAVPEENKEDAFVDGMDKVYKQLMKTLEEAGVKPIEAVGKEFDPNFHNAVMHVENEELGENVVAAEFQKGYTYKETVVRHSMVQVAN
ncbi:MAG TPA: nucleotide exchange factor GrpE [Candidatus Fimimorpha faecalis]|uniref:Protein GrpE n=1 Tax=Candidatus Fimimorpha faecalis TaxID=2840824 RepID=A0A9D1EFF5_9FIRM|nr:nucleotide exchange factor GrpE [Candidatus Fimimorpha faecalis]